MGAYGQQEVAPPSRHHETIPPVQTQQPQTQQYFSWYDQENDYMFQQQQQQQQQQQEQQRQQQQQNQSSLENTRPIATADASHGLESSAEAGSQPLQNQRYMYPQPVGPYMPLEPKTEYSARPSEAHGSNTPIPLDELAQQFPSLKKHIVVQGSVGQVAPPGLRPRVTTALWEDEQTLCFQVEHNGTCIARRADNNMINGTKLLNVTGMTRGRRDGLLKGEKVRHVVKIGTMYLKGVWIPYERALDFAVRENLVDRLYPLFVADINTFLYHPLNATRTAQVMVAANRKKQSEKLRLLQAQNQGYGPRPFDRNPYNTYSDGRPPPPPLPPPHFSSYQTLPVTRQPDHMQPPYPRPSSFYGSVSTSSTSPSSLVPPHLPPPAPHGAGPGPGISRTGTQYTSSAPSQGYYHGLGQEHGRPHSSPISLPTPSDVQRQPPPSSYYPSYTLPSPAGSQLRTQEQLRPYPTSPPQQQQWGRLPSKEALPTSSKIGDVSYPPPGPSTEGG